MRNAILSIIWIGLMIFLMESCTGGDSKGAKVSATVCDTMLDYYYKKYVSRADSILKVRSDTNIVKMIPIYHEIGEAYISAFRKQFPINSTHVLKFNKETLGFYYKYMVENNIDSLSFSFAKYDTSGFYKAGLSDLIYNQRASKMRDRWTVVVGVYDRTYGNTPFRIPGLQYAFYDDWADEWP